MQYRVAACGLIKLTLLYDNFFCIFTDLPPSTLHHIIIKMFIGSPESHGVLIEKAWRYYIARPLYCIDIIVNREASS